MVMCRPCGHFMRAWKKNGEWELKKDECPECEGSDFKNNNTGEVIETGE